MHLCSEIESESCEEVSETTASCLKHVKITIASTAEVERR